MAKTKAFGIAPKNKEQAEALEALVDPSIDLVVLDGCAGTGKTLLAIAAGLEGVMEKKNYTKVIFTRAPVPIGYGLGLLPGTLEEKLLPWVGALTDNLELLGLDKIAIERYIELASIEHMRGRSLTRKWLIIDEIQNISIQQMKVLLTRAGEDTKIVCMGDPDQTDNKTLSRTNNALYYLIHMQDKPEFFKHVKLIACERSRLAEWAAKNIEV